MTDKKTEYDPKWKGDVLERSESAKFLTKYLNSLYAEEVDESINSNSFVLCLNAEWGYGKTFLIEHWAQDLKAELNHPVVYFDAWQNDFSDDPLLAFMSELEHSLEEFEKHIPSGEALIQGVIKTGKGAIAPVVKTAANVFLKKVVGSDTEGLVEIFNAASESAIDHYVKNALDAHNNRKAKVKEFSKKLGELLKKLKQQNYSLPMYVFIDELDRCKPSYAIQLLEGIKHIFGTAGVFFVVATNKVQLSNSIKAVYGSEFDSIGYLQRFFDQEYQLPKPNFDEFSKLLIGGIYRLSQLEIVDLGIKKDIVGVFSCLAGGFNLSLRAQEQSAKQLKAIVLSELKHRVHIWYLLFLIMFKIKNELAYFEFLKLKDVPQGFELLGNYFDTRITIQGRVPLNDRFETRLEHISVVSIFREYIKLEPQAYSDLNSQGMTVAGTIGAVRLALTEEARIGVQGNFHALPTISQYQKLILQAGQLT